MKSTKKLKVPLHKFNKNSRKITWNSFRKSFEIAFDKSLEQSWQESVFVVNHERFFGRIFRPISGMMSERVSQIKDFFLESFLQFPKEFEKLPKEFRKAYLGAFLKESQ